MSNRLALILEGGSISWFAIFVAAGCLIGTVAACIARACQKKSVSDVLLCVTFGVPLGVVFARVIYWLFNFTEFESAAQVLDVTRGGYGLYGAFLGVWLSVLLVVKCFDGEGTGLLLDCMAIGGSLAIAVGRFATYFTSCERGFVVDLPFMTVSDPVRGGSVFAVFLLDGILENVIFAVCVCFFAYCLRQGAPERTGGMTAMVMLALHGASQVLCDSMRDEPLKLSFNRFIKASQIIGIITCMVVLVLYLVLSVRASGWKLRHTVTVILIPVLITLGVYGEYRVGNGNYISKHMVMLGAMIGLCVLAVMYVQEAVRVRTERGETQPE